jgi:hypothetical protein
VAAAAIFISCFEANFTYENELYCNSCKYFKETKEKNMVIFGNAYKMLPLNKLYISHCAATVIVFLLSLLKLATTAAEPR